MVTLFVTAHLLIGVASGFLFDRPDKQGQQDQRVGAVTTTMTSVLTLKI